MPAAEQFGELPGQLGDDPQVRVVEHQRHAGQAQVRELPVVQPAQFRHEGLERVEGVDGPGQCLGLAA